MRGMTETTDTLPILVVPDAALKARAKPVTPADMERVHALVPRMFATMYKAPGIGLAAPQVGVGLRCAVIDLMATESAVAGVYNIGSDEPITIHALAQRVVQAANPGLAIEFQPYRDAYDDDLHAKLAAGFAVSPEERAELVAGLHAWRAACASGTGTAARRSRRCTLSILTGCCCGQTGGT